MEGQNKKAIPASQLGQGHAREGWKAMQNKKAIAMLLGARNINKIKGIKIQSENSKEEAAGSYLYIILV